MKTNVMKSAAGVIALLIFAGAILPTSQLSAWARTPALEPADAGQAPPAPHIRHGGANWNVVASPNEGDGHNELWGVDALSSSDVWAVGYHNVGTVERTLVERWNGSTWSVIPSPNVGGNNNRLTGVAAVSGSDAWAVGTYDNGAVERTLIMRWDGSAWSIVPSPNVGSNENFLTGVAAISANDVWAVGYYFPGGPAFNTLTLHWDGSTWSVVSSPNAGNNFLTGVSALSSSDVWAVGYYLAPGFLYQTLILRWNGSEWTQVPGANTGSDGSFLLAVSALSSSDVWAVGYFINNVTWNTLTIHWDGSAWSVVPSPSPGGSYNFLNGVSAVSANDVWAVGYYFPAALSQTLIEHWDGSAWTIVPSPNVGASVNQLDGIDAVSAGDVWAVGFYLKDLTYQTLVERYTISSGSPTPIATGTQTGTPTPLPLTQTPQNPTSTPTATATLTPCPINFTDVLPTDYFYEAVHYLYCAGVISGYSDGTFRPYNNTTRGQLTKIVVLGFGIPIYTPATPTFTDVPANHTFYQYIETAAHEGLVSGYSDGTFRPENNVTRGQLSKIVVIAAGWPLLNPPTPTFTDVPLGSPFYQHIATAYEHGIISGYADGTFRPGNNATRGQISKIVHSALTAP